MGFEPREVGYLWYCEKAGLGTLEINEIKILGEKLESVAKKFRPHQIYTHQRSWKIENEEEIMKILG